MRHIRSFVVCSMALVAAALLPVVAAAGGISGPAFYVDGVLYRTVATPTDLSSTGAPSHSFDVIYSFGGAQEFNVATAAPGDRDYNGGRWEVHAIAFIGGYEAALATYDANGSGEFDNDAEVLAALNGGAATDEGVVRRFVCTVNRLPGRS